MMQRLVLELQKSDSSNLLDSIISFLDHGAVGLLGGIIVTLSITLATRKRKIPMYSAQSRRILIESELRIKELDIAYKGVPLTDLTVTHVAFFNAGRAVIRSKDDIPKAGAITLKACNPDVEIIGHPAITRFSTESNKMSISQAKVGQGYVIEFDYLAHNDGAIIQVAHTGTSSSDLTIEGIVHEGTKIKKINEYQSIGDTIEFFAYSFVIIYLPFFAFFLILFTLVENPLLGVMLLLVLPYLFLCFCYIYWTPRKWARVITKNRSRSILNKIIPPGLDRFRIPDNRNIYRRLYDRP